MVKTRSVSKREQHDENAATTARSLPPTNEAEEVQAGPSRADNNIATANSVKSEIPICVYSSSKANRSTTSSIEARKKMLELEAAEAKARIRMELIDKRLAADIANLNDEYGQQPVLEDVSNRSDVERWVENSRHEFESQQPAPLQGGAQKEPGPLCPPAPRTDAGTDGPIQQLANVLKDLLTTTATEKQNTNLLSRISTPKELPMFTGDPLEWLQFKTAYEESTRMCQFSDTENLWRLRKCLRGPAKEAVNALLITATSPDILLATLELQFGNSDVILSRIIYEIKKLSPMSSDYHKEIVIFSNKIKNYVAAVRALKREEYLQGMSIVTIVLSKLPTILLSKWSDYCYPRITYSTANRLELLAKFLHEEAVKISTCSATLLNGRPDYFKRKYFDKNDTNVQAVLLQNGQSELKCRYCKTSKHELTECKRFKKALRKDRWVHVKRFGLCYKCLVSQHDRQNCPAALCDVNNCGQAHHRLLHFLPFNQPLQSRNPVVEEPPETHTEANTEPEVVTHININSASAVLLKVVPINIHGPSGIINTTALLDDGSTVSLISAGLAARVGARGRRECMRVRGAWDNNELVCDTQIIDIALSNRDGTMFTFRARSVKELDLPKQNTNLVNCDNFTHLQRLKSDLCYEQSKPEILIGQDNYHLILPLEVVSGKPNEPCATRTPLGWCVHGWAPACVTSSAHALHTTLFITNHDDNANIIENKRLLNELHEEVRRNFAIDSMGISVKPRLNCEDERARQLLEQTSTLVDGKWYVGLPWKDENCVMPDSFPHAMSRLKNVEQKMKKDAGYKQRYSERVQHLFENDYARELLDPQATPRTWYLPHFGVDNPNKTKLRLVFDAAAKTNDLSLNHYLLKGPDLLMSLFGIMLRFRENRVAVTGDIKDMFLRVKIRAADQDALRFLYRNEPEGPVKTFAMTSLIFGANCSPFIAQFIKNKNAQRFQTSFPSATQAICSQHYMDDWIDSLPDEETAIKLIHDVRMIHQQGNFEIRNFTSNSKTVLESLPTETLGPTAVRFKIGEHYEGERTLGLIWRPEEDTLSYDVSFKKIPESVISGQQKPTKRDMLRVVMSIFDVYGFLSPFTIIGKIIIQETWRLNLTWDEPIPDDIYSEWRKWTNLIKSLENVRLPRYYSDAAAAGRASATHTQAQPVHSQLTQRDAPALLSIPASPNVNICYTNLQLHVFCDSSLQAMCAVAYWRWDWNGLINVAFIASKCRVTPNKNTSIPRLELQAAVLAARLADTIINAHKMKAERKVFWCDSSTTLHWIRNEARTYKPYVAHRLGEIDELTNIKEWRYVPTKLNAADMGTRKSYDRSILDNEWLKGPTFLRCSESNWPTDALEPENNINDLECVCLMKGEEIDLPVPEPTRFSSWLRLLRSTHMVLTFINRCRKLTDDVTGTNMDYAENLLLRHSQTQSFGQEVSNLKLGKHLQKDSKILTLSPFLDEHGVLRAGGRIDAADDVAPATKRPAILEGRDYTARLIVKFYHTSAAHGNQELVVNNLKQRYWITKIRPTVKSVVSKCIICRIKKCKPEVPRMGDLPNARMAHHQRPFSFCGVDLFGPMEVTIGRRREKRYGVLFTCLTVRAIHLETVGSLTSDSFIMALRRMAARRGWPQQIFSDNGTNLRGADTELKRSIQELDVETLKDEAMNHGTKWTFIPAASPHWGGAWERLIRSVKTSLKAILKERAPKEETFNTLLAEVENIVNSRPLTHVSVEPNSDEALSPNHFLVGTSSNLPQIGVYDGSEVYLRKQWRIALLLADQYWKRWVKEVLPDLIPRKKWHVEQRPLQVGDLVLLVEPNGPRNVWPRGVIQRVMPGRDGRVRMVQVKTKTGVLTRSAARVARLPVGNECC